MKNKLNIISKINVREALLKGYLFALSIFFLYVGITSIGKPEVAGILICIGMGIAFNPLFVDKIMGKMIKSLPWMGKRYFWWSSMGVTVFPLTKISHIDIIYMRL